MTLRLTEEEYQALIQRRNIDPLRVTKVALPTAKPGRKGRPSPAADEFAAQLVAACIPFQREYLFTSPRKFRFDFVLLPLCMKLAVEIDGGVHRIDNRWRSDMEKGNLALDGGWRVYHFARDAVIAGEALLRLRGAMQLPAIRTCNSLLLTR